MGKPKVAILDELSTGLDPQARRETWHLIESMRDRGVTVLLVTHLMEEAERLADRVAVIDGGRLIAVDTPSGIVARVDPEQKLRFRPSAPIEDRLLTDLPEVKAVERTGPVLVVTGTGNLINAVTSVLAQHQVVANDLRVEQANLDDAYLALTAHPAEGAVMNELRAHIATETRLLFRDPISWLAAVALPSVVLLVFGGIFPPEPDPALGGLRWLDLFVPSLVVISTATLAIQTLPIRLATYREKGILRRLSTTPARPSRMLAAQLIIYTTTAVIGMILLVITGRVAFGIPLPVNPLAYVAAFALGMAALLAIGLVVAAVAPSSRTATAIAIPMFFAVMLLGGVYLPRYLLPDVLITIGNFTPPGVQGLQDAWLGTAPQLLPLVVLAGITLVGGFVASRVFRWE